ncbi:replicative DNA helicase Mcm [Halomicrobium zhouii]|uniref:DNA helicase n=1 Tax=Halomicrobium zhouii TaxID=767519 RepID=A0A1I6K6Z4_9EURY|nr:LAGLIDADG family homing endonuclease [Halomicrobium zhouii]SFR86924.1 replicative DNA helicase Mcm [Halomicrobium zhouii]
MATAENTELTDAFEEFYRNYYRNEIGELAQKYPTDQKSLWIDWQDLYRFDPDLADDFRNKPAQLQDYAEEALRLYDLPVDVKLGQAHVRVHNLPQSEDIRAIRHEHHGNLISVQGIVRKATDVRPKVTNAAFECQRCGTLTRIPQVAGDFQEPHECQGCERQGPFRLNMDQSEFVDAQKLRVQESPEGLRGGETPQAIDVSIEDDICGEVTAGDHVNVTGVLKLDQQGNDREKSPMFDLYMDGVDVSIEDQQFEDMDITDEDKKDIVELSNEDGLYEKMVGAIAPSIYGYDQEKLAMILQLFSGVTKHLPDESRIRGDLHMLMIGDPGTGKSQMLSYVENIAPRSVYTSGKGSSSAGLTAAAVRDDFGEGQQWTLEAGALVLADQGIAAIDELDKMRCVTGDTLVHLGDRVTRIRDFAHEAAESGSIEELPNGRTIRDFGAQAWTMTEEGRLEKRSVTAIHEYDAPEALTQVTLRTGERLTSTADHPFFVFDDGERIERGAAELEQDDWVFVPRSLTEAATDGGVAATRPSETPNPTDGLSPSLGAVLGYLAGDGNLYYDREEGVYGIRFTNIEEQLLTDFEQCCRDAFDSEPVRPPSEQRGDGVQTVRLAGRDVADAVIDAGMNQEIYDGKRLPEEVTASSRTAKAAFLRALADSEGSVGERNVKIHSASYELLMGAKHLLLEFDISSQIQTRERDGRRDLYILAITDADSLASFDRHVGFTLDRKQSSLSDVVASVSGDRTILDVLPDCGDLLAECRDSLRLYQAECGLNDATYCNFENGDANISLRLVKQVLEAFEQRKHEARDRLDDLNDADWATLESIRTEFHVSQAELAKGTKYRQDQISTEWGEDPEMRAAIEGYLLDVLGQVGAADISTLTELVHADVKWRRVESVDQVAPDETDDHVRILEGELADLISCSPEDATETAHELLAERPSPDDWSELRETLETYGISMTAIGTDVGVDQATISRWSRGVVSNNRFEEVRDATIERVDAIRDRAAEILREIESRSGPSVYDLTVDGTHNFVANGMIVHNSEDRSAMHQALEQQEISINKAGINATLKSRCSLLGAANPKYGRFDQFEPIGEQIDLEPALISRFDLIFTVTDQPDEEEDANLADHIIQTNYAGELNTHREQNATSDYSEEEVANVTDEVAPTIEPELLRKYIAYAKRNCYPTMTEEAKEAIRDFYVDLRAKGQDDDAPVPVTARKLEALVRLAEASARIRLSDTVEEEDSERVIQIVRSSMEDIGVDPETGEFDADVVETGTSKTQRDRIQNIKGIINDIESEYDEGAPIDVVVERAEEVGVDQSKAEHEIEQLKQKGEVYEPRTDHLRTT